MDLRRDVASQVRRAKIRMGYTFISCADKKRTKEAADGSAPRNPLRRSHFQDTNGIKVSKTQRLCGIIRPQRLSASFVCCNLTWL